MENCKRMFDMWTETIHIQGPYNFDLVLDRLSLDPLHVIDVEQKIIKVPLYIDKKPHVIYVQASYDSAFLIRGESEAPKSQAVEQIKKVFHWHQPLTEVATHFQQTDLHSLFEEHHGTPIVLDFDYYSCLVRCIIHQQLNLAFAHKLTERYVQTFGEKMDGVWFFPTPERAAHLTVAELRDLQFSTRKAEYLIGLSEQVASGQLQLEKLALQSNQDIMDTLMKVRGIGRWTVENFLLFGLGRPNLFPKADIGIQNAIKKLYNLEQKPTQEEMETYSKNWSPYLSYASLYLWRSVEKRSEKK